MVFWLKRITAGNMFTFIGFGFYLFLIANLLFYFIPSPQPGVPEMSYNENRALGNLKSIHQAQEVFRETDRDQNGKNAYASFYIHLWQAVDDTGEVVPVNLISRNLAFAMGPSREINGYYFKDIHFRFDDQGREVLLDPEKEWALTAVPVQMGLTGRFIFLIDQKGGVYVKMAYEAPDIFPYDPISSGWVLVKDKIDMDAL